MTRPTVAVTSREVKALYTREERALAKKAYQAAKVGDDVTLGRIVGGAMLGIHDSIAVVDHVVPVYSPDEIAAAQAAAVYFTGDTIETWLAMLGDAGLTADDHFVMGRWGFLDQDVTGQATAVTEPAAEEFDPERIHVLTLPDGTDHRRPDVQATVEARVREALGPHWVVMWPRNPDVVDGIDPAFTVVNARPYAREVPLGAGARPTDDRAVAAQGEQAGYGTLVAFDPYRGTATFADLDGDTVALRNRLADLLRCRPHEVEVVLHHVDDEKTGRRRLDQVVITHAPAASTDPEKRKATWGNLLVNVPGGTSGWEIIEDPIAMVTRLRYGQPRTLPQTVPMADLLPAMDTSAWHHLPLGVDPEGKVAAIDLTAGPHALIVGPTGSGKSVLLRQHAAAALSRGHHLIVVDAIKDGIDFAAFKPWCVAFGDDGVVKARTIIEAVYEEGMRRKALLKAYEAPSWLDLPPDVRRAERVVPLTVLFDEFMSAVIATPVPKGLDKDDPLVVEANELNSAKAIILALVGKIARELRFTGVFLAVAMQRPDASLLAGFGEIRSNLTSAVQLVKPGSLPAQETLRMVFPGDQTHVAAETIMELDDGRSKGLATVAAEGGDVTGFRVGFGRRSIPELLEFLGVPKPTPWVIEPPKPAPKEGDIISGTPPRGLWGAPEVEDLGFVAVSLADLEDADAVEDFEPAPTVPRRQQPADDLWT